MSAPSSMSSSGRPAPGCSTVTRMRRLPTWMPLADGVTIESGRARDDTVVREVLSERPLSVGPIVVHGDRIAYLGKNSDRALLLAMGCARAGMVLVPVIWRLAPAEIDFILKCVAPDIRTFQAFVIDVNKQARGSQIVLSRTSPGLLMKLFEMEVPEIYEGIVRIVAVAREPGERTKIAVASRDPDVDPVGACVGMKGTRVQAIIRELRGEKIDIVEWSDDPIQLVPNALSPA